jgi:hypothetical protein
MMRRRARGTALATATSRTRPVAKHPAPGVRQARNDATGRRPSSASSDHWKRLLRRPAREPVALGAQAFVDELNRRLHEDSAWRADTRFVVATGDDGAVVGTTWEGPDAMKPAVARIVKSVIGEYDAGQPFFFDR